MDKSNIERKKIGLFFLFTYQEWTGGLIYILNIISALNTLDDEEKPELIILHTEKAPIEDIIKINYTYIRFELINPNTGFLNRTINRFCILLTGKSIYFNRLPDVVYPHTHEYSAGKKPFFWIPDFQEWYLPQMFSETEVKLRKKKQLKISKSNGTVVFSSMDALKDFKKFFPDHLCNLKLLRFSCSLPDFNHLDIENLKLKFAITKSYFMSPNQFWKHKNHKVILEAIVALKEKNLNYQVVFTGSESDYRNKEYFGMLKDYISANQIEPWVKFLGFIDRAEQLKLMNESIAIIQPSFFEGWSTVVEDAKALNQFILLSNIKVHIEQISDNCMFFDPNSYSDLAAQMELMISNPPIRKIIDYNQNIHQFAKTITEVLKV